ncbi:MAG TPA: LacI family DNA-binding transcriptional regulator [Propionibacteriaceae bacterium]|nr:LacI family DNA-binding transcriptional regulator [Propionibacteriaceae bacterium]
MAQRRAATQLDVARAAGVSRAAVSKVVRNAYGISPELRSRVEEKIRDLGYRPSLPARAIKGSSMTLGFELRELETPALPRILRGSTKASHEAGYQLVVAPTATSESRTGYEALEALVDLHVDGIVAVAPLVDPGWLERLAERVPIVLLSRHDESRGYDTMAGNDEAGAALAMQHLFSLGHRHIAHLTRGEDDMPEGLSTPLAVRLATYRKLMEASGYGQFTQVVRTPVGRREGYGVVRRLLKSAHRPTALFAASDDLALDALQACSELGLEAADLSVVGYDNIRVAGHPRISLTTVDQSGEELGARAVRLLVQRVQGRTKPKHELTRPRLVVRGTTAPPRT